MGKCSGFALSPLWAGGDRRINLKAVHIGRQRVVPRAAAS